MGRKSATPSQGWKAWRSEDFGELNRGHIVDLRWAGNRFAKSLGPVQLHIEFAIFHSKLNNESFETPFQFQNRVTVFDFLEHCDLCRTRANTQPSQIAVSMYFVVSLLVRPCIGMELCTQTKQSPWRESIHAWQSDEAICGNAHAFFRRRLPTFPADLYPHCRVLNIGTN